LALVLPLEGRTMPNHSPEHLERITRVSASRRRAEKIARLISTAPPMDAQLVADLVALLDSRVADGGAR
jgi:hypothetical protein